MFFFAVLCPGTNEGSTSIGSGFKASQKMGQRLKVSSDRLKEAGNRTCDPWFLLIAKYNLYQGKCLFILMVIKIKYY